MNQSLRIVCDFEVVSPMFLSGADQRVAEVRAPSVRGALRFWYRALEPEFRRWEPEFWGWAGSRASRASIGLKVVPRGEAKKEIPWAKFNAAQFDQGNGKFRQNGLTYLGYPFPLGKVERAALEPGSRFTVTLTVLQSRNRDPAPRGHSALHAAVGSVWALGHWGALGSRSRRGFGAVALLDWRAEDLHGRPVAVDELTKLPLLSRVARRQDWLVGMNTARSVLEGWFGTFPVHTHHPHWGSKARYVVLREEKRRTDWRGMLAKLGGELQKARLRSEPDYSDVKAHVLHESGDQVRGRRIQRVPARATFGLPLTFRFSSVPKSKSVTFVPLEQDRHGSLLLVRPVLAGDQLFGLFLRLDGDVPGFHGGGPTGVGVQNTRRPLVEPERNALDEFMNELRRLGDHE